MTLQRGLFPQNGQIHVGYQDLMENYQLLVVNMAKQREEKEVKLVLNLFQSLLDEFARSYAKKEDLGPAKVCGGSSFPRGASQTSQESFVGVGHMDRLGMETCAQKILPLPQGRPPPLPPVGAVFIVPLSQF